MSIRLITKIRAQDITGTQCIGGESIETCVNLTNSGLKTQLRRQKVRTTICVIYQNFINKIKMHIYSVHFNKQKIYRQKINVKIGCCYS